jgi:hypothetical protein
MGQRALERQARLTGSMSREAPRGYPDMVFAQNQRPGSGFNLMAQALAQGYSPPIGQVFARSDFNTPDGLSRLSQYAPRGLLNNTRPTENWQDNARSTLARAGMRVPGYGDTEADAGTNTGTDTGTGAGTNTETNPATDWFSSLTPEQRQMLSQYFNLGNLFTNTGTNAGTNTGTNPGANPRQAWRNSLTPQQLQLAQSNRQAFRESLTPEQRALQQAAEDWRSNLGMGRP